MHDLLENIFAKEKHFKREDIIIYREDKKKYLLNPLQLTDLLDDATDNGQVCVLEFKGTNFAEYNSQVLMRVSNDVSLNYISAQEHYQTLSQRVWVNFIPNESKIDAWRTLQDGNMRYSEVE